MSSPTTTAATRFCELSSVVRINELTKHPNQQGDQHTMPKASKTTATDSMVLDGYEGHFENLEGGYTVGFETYTADADLTPLFAGLPDDRCQCAHWGYVVKGKVTFKTATGDETFESGDAYYVGPGHTPILYAGTEVIEFSPTTDLQRTLEVVERNLAAATD